MIGILLLGMAVGFILGLSITVTYKKNKNGK